MLREVPIERQVSNRSECLQLERNDQITTRATEGGIESLLDRWMNEALAKYGASSCTLQLDRPEQIEAKELTIVTYIIVRERVRE